MERTTKDVDKYLDSLPDDVREDMKTLDSKISEIMKGKTRTLWEGVFWGGSQQTIIAYADYVIQRPKKKDVEWFHLGLALQKNYISLYINTVEDKMYVVEKNADKLGKAKIGKSSVSFKKLEDVNMDELMKLVKIANEQDA